MKNNVIILASLKIKEGKRNEFLDLFKPIIEATRNEAGCIRYDLFQDTEDENIFTFIEEYDSEASFDAHRNMPYMISMRDKRELLKESYLGVEKLIRC